MADPDETRCWSSLSIKERCQIVAGVATVMADATEELIRLCTSDQRRDPVETITSELLPLASALRWIGRRGTKVLAPRKCGIAGRPVWLAGVHSTVSRQPHGKVLILGAWNYPLLLTGVQMAQGLAAGNRVIVKPAIGCEAATERMIQAFHAGGVPTTELIQIDSSADAAIRVIDAGVDLIVLTGAASTGRAVMRQAAETLTPTIMELSGCDAVIVMPDADIERAADAIDFALNFNSGATCIAPRRLIAESTTADQLKSALVKRQVSRRDVIVHSSARSTVADIIERSIASGCVDVTNKFDATFLRQTGKMAPAILDSVEPHHPVASADLFAPVTSIMRVEKIDDAVRIVNDCPYRLAASVFGNRKGAVAIASRLSVGSVSINDVIVPTADPRVPFGGRGSSGFGVTRGEEGLLAMTTAKVTAVRHGKWMPHLRPRTDKDIQILSALVALLHGSMNVRWKAIRRVLGK
ncbi:aldehyde dehydrogenase family protein [Rubripirellula reticaptiva]|uniref:Succinate-semialdehyde dehydrogenase [NADP(+)] n=1 Tax=Rubripirellula reticaptiva TaxID=2528013 RepID=A0A5C6EU57_9BACT|nr:aldehyde dehydrogenase family protein [Rubripirellula reticaptiva]TWU51924.1 Succinate-semialdehyde dehydrogenase [NADP(+)] [Rubripirellula reticaptiva]